MRTSAARASAVRACFMRKRAFACTIVPGGEMRECAMRECAMRAYAMRAHVRCAHVRCAHVRCALARCALVRCVLVRSVQYVSCTFCANIRGERMCIAPKYFTPKCDAWKCRACSMRYPVIIIFKISTPSISFTHRGLTPGYPGGACSVSRTAAGPEVATCRLSWKDRSPARDSMQEFHHNHKLQHLDVKSSPRPRATQPSAQ
eukprot:2185911-Pleurochrysis_carterae.AAC.2